MSRIEPINKSYWPKDTNTLANIYEGVKKDHVLLLHEHMWQYKDPTVRETRAQEIILTAWEVLNESGV